jgi:uncharacterized protein YkwD
LIRHMEKGTGGQFMRRPFCAVLICAALGGCASSGMFSSIGSIGGSEPERPAKEASTQPSPSFATSSSPSGGSSLGGIWSNFSSVFSSGAQPVAAKAEGPGMQALDPNEALRLVNEYRAQKHLNPLTLDPQASQAAQILAKDMAAHDHMSHTGPDGQDVGKRLLSAGYSYKLAAENVGVGQATIQETVEGWKKSPPHSRNLLLPNAKHIGVAYEYKPGTKYKTFWALVVAAPAS